MIYLNTDFITGIKENIINKTRSQLSYLGNLIFLLLRLLAFDSSCSHIIKDPLILSMINFANKSIFLQ